MPSVRPDGVWPREAGLDVDAEPYDGRRPHVWCADSPVPVSREPRQPWPARPGQPARDDDAYRRAGTANRFLCGQPLRGWRHGNVTARRTKEDCAMQMQEVGDVPVPEADVMRLVVDPLHPPPPAARYETCTPEAARRITRTLAWPSTPKPGRGRTMAACAFAVLTE